MAKIHYVVDGNGQKFYPITIANAVAYIKQNGTQQKLNEFLDSLNSSNEGKADKVSGAVSGNFAGLDANGNLTDSGVKAADFKTKQTAVADPTAEGNATSFIDTISQNANGELTATKKTIPTVAASTNGVGGNAGLMTAAQAEKLAAVEADADVNILEGVQVNGTDLTPDANKKVNVTVAEGDNNGEIKVNGSAVAVHGLGTAAFTPATDYDAAGAAATAKSEVIGAPTDASSANTIYGAKKKAEEEAAAVLGTNADVASDNTVYGAKAYADGLASAIRSEILAGKAYQGTVASNAGLPNNLTANDAGKYYIVTGTGKFAYWNGTSWDYVDQETSVSNDNTDLVIGTAVQIATVEGTTISVKQVEDTTKLECEACGDTSDYADVSALFTTPAAGE